MGGLLLSKKMDINEAKDFVKKRFAIGSGKRITEVLNRYYKHVNYYKKELNESPLFKEAKKIFKND